MTYIDGFVLAVPTAKRQAFIEQAAMVDELSLSHGALRVVECWGEDVPRGKQTDFWEAVRATDGEAVVFSWIEWPDKATRDANMPRLEAAMKEDPRFSEENSPMTFDGKRMIMGGFETILDNGALPPGDYYVQGFVVPAAAGQREAYRALADKAWALFTEYGAVRHVEAFEDDVPDGKLTDMRLAVAAQDAEQIVFSFVAWPSRAVCDAAAEKMQSDERMAELMPDPLPFNAARMIYGGFVPIIDLKGDDA